MTIRELCPHCGGANSGHARWCDGDPDARRFEFILALFQERDDWRARALDAEVKLKGLERGRVTGPLEERGRF